MNAAINVLKEVVREYPDALPFRLNLSLRFYDTQQYDKVIKNCEYILKKDPLYTRALILLGDTYDALQKPLEALKNYRGAVKLEPENISLKIKQAELLIKYKQFKEALAVYNSLLGKKDVADSPDILYKIALFNTQYGSMSKAEELLGKIIRLKSEGKYYYYHALILAKNGKIMEAIQSMESALNTYGKQLSAQQKSRGQQALKLWKENI